MYCQAKIMAEEEAARQADENDDFDEEDLNALMASEVDAAVCSALSSYSIKCADTGIILAWRTSTICRKCCL